MKKKNLLTIIIILLLLISMVSKVAGVTGKNGGEGKEEEKELNLTYSFCNLEVKKEGKKVSLEVEGADELFVKENHYIVPVKIEKITFPWGSKIKEIYWKTGGIHLDKLPGKLEVASSPVLIGNGKNVEEDDSEEPVSIDQWVYYDIGSGIEDGKRCIILKIEVFPIMYLSSIDAIQWVESITLTIRYTEGEESTSDGEYEFLILTPLEYEEEIQRLVDHKIKLGVSTKVVTLDEIYNGVYFPVKGRDNQEKIKYFIKNAIERWGVISVLLVGGIARFPIRYAHVKVGKYRVHCASDLYYADIYNETGGFQTWDTNNNSVFGERNWNDNNDKMDLYPDVYLGRIPCTTEEELKIVIDKIILFEENKLYEENWFKTIVLCGGDTFVPPDDTSGVSEGELVSERIENILYDFNHERIYASNGKLYNVANINMAIMEGAGFIDLSGHGSPISWSTHPHESDEWIPYPNGYNVSCVMKLSNKEKPLIAVIGACEVGRYTAYKNCLCWSFLANPNGGGVASFGPTAISFGYVGKSAVSGLCGKMQIDLFKAYKYEKACTLGEVWARNINLYIHPFLWSSDYLVIMEWQFFGDPTLVMAEESNPPEKPILDGQPEGKVGVNYTLVAYTSDPENNDVYFRFDWGDGNYSRWLGPYNPTQRVVVTHVWWRNGVYEVRVIAKDTHGVKSEWSDPLIVNITKKKNMCIKENLKGKPFKLLNENGLLFLLREIENIDEKPSFFWRRIVYLFIEDLKKGG
ncbi:MAG TPA: hypothetical protein ENG62_03295 [Thermoplasmatales archaeon]|nr:hypothetical protein [Thermoplasmatales archaeon]